MRIFSRIRRSHDENGQAMILVAVLMSALMGTMGVAIEGGRAFIEYRRLQSAADVAALVGAQKLPCKLTDSACAKTAEQDACSYAANNGFSTGSSCVGGSTGRWASVPPRSCSPYSFAPYGNTTDTNCLSAQTPQYYDYIEVALNDDLGTIPIFNIPVTLSAHAVAKHGGITGGDFGMMNLSPTVPLTMTGSTNVQVTGSVFSNNAINGGGSTSAATCDGGWLAAGSVTNVTSDTTGTPVFSTTGCTPSTSDTSADAQSNLPTMDNPYAGSCAPPSTVTSNPAGSGCSTTFTNCPECAAPGIWYDLDHGTWKVGGSPSGNVELFPGIYTNLTFPNNSQVYYNPGVYTISGSMDTNHGSMCVYGAPDCVEAACATTTFKPGDLTGDQWNYNCSPYGFWDSTLANSAPDSILSQAGLTALPAPTFYDPTNPASTSNPPLNGVAFYLEPGVSIIDHGNGGCGSCGSASGSVFLTASNPCPGTGTYTAASGSSPATTGAVSFPAGSAAAQFSYTDSESAYGSALSNYSSANFNMPNGLTVTGLQHGGVITSSGQVLSPAGQVYPSVDWSTVAECQNSYLDWPGEFTRPQHLHFLFYVPSGTSSILMNGASGQQYTGIMYAPNSSLTIDGAGKAAGGPPFINGQLIGGGITIKGNGYVDISYRPCGPESTGCGSSSDTTLIQ